ncbi:MAG TPA: hypothetical protein PLJ33_02895 [Peptococcaceae bacterium]|nr:hypothetical protein [Clostridia bacterium]HOB82396.1 hypothetical protein [Peptococcaceae bacterium]HPZ71204.1 hypothetical protein [Peptococcaceae bacterium]HQD53789.1 hypothetical protein [Peptococcaceae bacterium]
MENEGRTVESTEKAIQQESDSNGAGMEVRISSFEKGLEVYQNVLFIRVTSEKYNLLIMEDYMPIIGKVEGSVTFLAEDQEHTLENIEGFFYHKHNVFSLLIKESSHVDEDHAD